MQFPVKLSIGAACALVFIILFGFIAFPKIIKGKIKGMVSLKKGNEIRDMFLKVPFALTFKIYIFNVTNPLEIQNGETPKIKEIGPFCYEEWKTKVNVEDNEGDDTLSYNPVDTFVSAKWEGCLDGNHLVTVPHPMILGVVNTVSREKPGALTLLNKAIKSIYQEPSSIFLTTEAKNLLFDGVIIPCEPKDFASKAICVQLRTSGALKEIDEDSLAFSFFGMKNGTEGKRITALRGIQDIRNLGRIVTYDGQPKIDVWPSSICNTIKGTDGTIFPPFLKKEEGLVSYAPDLCRSLTAQYVKNTKYDGIPVRAYKATLGDMSKNPDERCYCMAPDVCLKKGIMDLHKCSGVPVYASLPHFYEADEMYVKGVKGLEPKKENHEILILFESNTGSPVFARKRLQFSMPLEPNAKVDLFHNFTPTILPIFWIEEGVELNRTYTKPLKDLFSTKKAVNITKWIVLLASLGGLGASGYLYFKQAVSTPKPSVKKVKPAVESRFESSNSEKNENDVERY